MGDDPSAYAVLGLEADADDSAIEQAYRRLIKRHHPDRSGGDTHRATELNRAYRELRVQRNLRDPLDFNDADEPQQRQRRIWLFASILLVAAGTLMLSRISPPVVPLGSAATPAASPLMAGKRVRPGPMEGSLDLVDIDRAAAEALRLRRTSDEMGLASRSRSCHQALRVQPTLGQFDQCAAFDTAVVMLQNRDPLRDQGPFSELAVTGRIRSAAALLSDDSVAIDARLDRIRREIETTLATAEN